MKVTYLAVHKIIIRRNGGSVHYRGHRHVTCANNFFTLPLSHFMEFDFPLRPFVFVTLFFSSGSVITSTVETYKVNSIWLNNVCNEWLCDFDLPVHVFVETGFKSVFLFVCYDHCCSLESPVCLNGETKTRLLSIVQWILGVDVRPLYPAILQQFQVLESVTNSTSIESIRHKN